ncbi:MAG: FAD-binding oxidoreductase [Bacteriovoracaceae bacterium]|nr:FAD-binding oxidoreductase [Bacteriovoracaceae bacterium]
MSVSFWMDQGQTLNSDAFDIVIVGGGIAGLSAAFWLAKSEPNFKIALVEKYRLGDGATGRNAGFITCGSVEHFNRLVENFGKEKALEIWRFSEENLRLLKEEIIEDQASALFFEEFGSFSLASTEKEFSELQESASLMESMKIAVEFLDKPAVENRLGAENFVGGIKYKGDASVHPLNLLLAIRKKIEQNFSNVSFFENHEVYEIETLGEDKIVKTRAKWFTCPMVVIAANGYSPQIHSYFKDKIFPTRGQILATEPVARFMEGPCYANFVLDYFRQLPTGEVVIGGFRQLQKDVEVGYSDEITPIIQEALEEFLKKHIPNVAKAKITHRWSGIMGFSADGQPLVGALPTDNQVAFLGGFTAHGLGLAFHGGKVLTDSLMGRALPDFISAKRFN